MGGWGKPPVDETGRPLYGDVFGVEQQEAGPVGEEEEIDKSLWGELESEEEEEEEEEVCAKCEWGGGPCTCTHVGLKNIIIKHVNYTAYLSSPLSLPHTHQESEEEREEMPKPEEIQAGLVTPIEG